MQTRPAAARLLFGGSAALNADPAWFTGRATATLGSPKMVGSWVLLSILRPLCIFAVDPYSLDSELQRGVAGLAQGEHWRLSLFKNNQANNPARGEIHGEPLWALSSLPYIHNPL